MHITRNKIYFFACSTKFYRKFYLVLSCNSIQISIITRRSLGLNELIQVSLILGQSFYFNPDTTYVRNSGSDFWPPRIWRITPSFGWGFQSSEVGIYHETFLSWYQSISTYAIVYLQRFSFEILLGQKTRRIISRHLLIIEFPRFATVYKKGNERTDGYWLHYYFDSVHRL